MILGNQNFKDIARPVKIAQGFGNSLHEAQPATSACRLLSFSRQALSLHSFQVLRNLQAPCGARLIGILLCSLAIGHALHDHH